jgi:hypothetical protein
MKMKFMATTCEISENKAKIERSRKGTHPPFSEGRIADVLSFLTFSSVNKQSDNSLQNSLPIDHSRLVRTRMHDNYFVNYGHRFSRFIAKGRGDKITAKILDGVEYIFVTLTRRQWFHHIYAVSFTRHRY